MPRLTRELLRKRAEHNEGLIGTLEEIALHQEELEKIEVIGTHCRRLKILYLQNNIIPKIENLHHLKELQYLNLAINNITKIEGLSSCEFLSKLDLTLNFIDFDEIEESLDHLSALVHLKELFMMGNPCQVNWDKKTRTAGEVEPCIPPSERVLEDVDDSKRTDRSRNKGAFFYYCIGKVPQLSHLDGQEITQTDRILALQRQQLLQEELDVLASKTRAEKRKSAHREAGIDKQATCDEATNQTCSKTGASTILRSSICDVSPKRDETSTSLSATTEELDVLEMDDLGSFDLAGLSDSQQSGHSEKTTVPAMSLAEQLPQAYEEEPNPARHISETLSKDGTKDDAVPYTPESRREMYLELAAQKAEKEARERERMPKERDYEKEHREKLHNLRQMEAETQDGEIRQCNEGKWDFALSEDEEPGCITLEVATPKYLDTSLIDVDVHPTYVSICIKGKTLRLKFMEEVVAHAGKAERSRITGKLKLTLPKMKNYQSSIVGGDGCVTRRARGGASTQHPSDGRVGGTTDPKCVPKNTVERTRILRPRQKLGDEILHASMGHQIANIVKREPESISESHKHLPHRICSGKPLVTVVGTSRQPLNSRNPKCGAAEKDCSENLSAKQSEGEPAALSVEKRAEYFSVCADACGGLGNQGGCGRTATDARPMHEGEDCDIPPLEDF